MGPQIKGANFKKRKLTSHVEEISFDPSSREEFLTGFRKRKQQRIKNAQAVAESRAREDKRQTRKKLREERKVDFERAVEEHKRQLKRLQEENEIDGDSENASSDNDEDEWDGIPEPPAVDYEAEYIDEDKYTTVTVEEMDPSREGLLYSNDSSDEQPAKRADPSEDEISKKQPEKAKNHSDNKLKKKKKKFRYESKQERKVTRMKERSSNSKKAKARREQ
ncbi:nucleolar protein 12-domain-containing protein [Aspergillus californicus]